MANLSVISKFEKQAVVNVWVGQTLKLMLLTENHVPNAGTQQYVSDVLINEVVDENDVYTAGGIPLSGLQAVADPNDPNNYFLDADDLKIGPGTTITYKYGIIYQDMGTSNHSVNPIKAHIDFIENQEITNGISTINWNQLGIIYVR